MKDVPGQIKDSIVICLSSGGLISDSVDVHFSKSGLLRNAHRSSRGFQLHLLLGTGVLSDGSSRSSTVVCPRLWHGQDLQGVRDQAWSTQPIRSGSGGMSRVFHIPGPTPNLV